MVHLQRKKIVKATNCVQNLLYQLEHCENNCDNQKSSNNQLSSAERNIIFLFLSDICKDCENMASLPQGAFAACKLRDSRIDQDLTLSRMKSGTDKNDPKNSFENKKLLEYSPVKYNGKLMNSIWGLYNRYSPHNIKGNEYESANKGYFLQQQSAVASYAISQNLTMATKPGIEWCFAEK